MLLGILLAMDFNPNNHKILNMVATIQGVPKKVAIGPPKPQFLSETFEIFTVGRLCYSGFNTFFRFEKFLF